VRDELERVEIPGEEDARERAWSVVREAFVGRDPVPRPSHWPRVAAIAFALAALAAAALSPSGRAVIDEIRAVVGVENAQPALFSLPAEGRLLVTSDSGVWVVQEDGSKRLLGNYREASWSPFGRFVVAARENELVALEPDGKVRWTLARRGARSPRWAGTKMDTRIAYVDRTGLRIVAGDGTGDRLLVPGFRGRLAWRPGSGFVLAHVAPRRVRVVDARTGRLLWQAPIARGRITAVEWSSGGRRLLVQTSGHVVVHDVRGRIVAEERLQRSSRYVDGSFRPKSSELAVVRVEPAESRAYILNGRPLGTGIGTFQDLEWAPDGTWLVVTWPTADQWILSRASGRTIRAVANVSEQFRSRSFPRVEGWCCAP
jgi:outer membrane protein assembly factor BamB